MKKNTKEERYIQPTHYCLHFLHHDCNVQDDYFLLTVECFDHIIEVEHSLVTKEQLVSHKIQHHNHRYIHHI